MKTTPNHGFRKPDGTNRVNIEDLNYNMDVADEILTPVTTTKNGLMTKEDKTKLNGIATGANKYTHPATHSASMISGLHGVATSGSYNDLLNKPSTFPPSAHTHTKAQITDFPTSLPANGGNANTLGGYKPTADWTPNGYIPIITQHTPVEVSQWIDFHVVGSVLDNDARLYVDSDKGLSYSSTNPYHNMSITLEINHLKESVVSGKQDIANAINDKGTGSSFSNQSPFGDMAWWIRNMLITYNMDKLACYMINVGTSHSSNYGQEYMNSDVIKSSYRQQGYNVNTGDYIFGTIRDTGSLGVVKIQDSPTQIYKITSGSGVASMSTYSGVLYPEVLKTKI